MPEMFGFGLEVGGSASGAPSVILEGWNTSALEAPLMTFSNANKTVVGNNNGGFGDNRCYSKASKLTTKWFASVRLDAKEYGDVSVCNDDDTKYVHYDNSGVIYTSDGATLATIAGYAAPCVIDTACDPVGHLVWFRVNGGNWNGNALYDPATSVGGYAIPVSLTPYHLKVQMPYFPDSQRTLNVGGSAFTYAAPFGFTPLGQ